MNKKMKGKMVFKSITLAATLLILSTSVNAAIISVDWENSGDNLITQDTVSGLEWLDLTATTNRTYNDISAKLGSGQEFEGWRYASVVEVSGFFDAFGGNSAFYIGESVENNGLFDAIAPFWGDTHCTLNACAQGEGESFFIMSNLVHSTDDRKTGLISELFSPIEKALSHDYVDLFGFPNPVVHASPLIGSALVRNTVVPVPAAVWLFGSGIIGLIGLARRKRA